MKTTKLKNFNNIKDTKKIDYITNRWRKFKVNETKFRNKPIKIENSINGNFYRY